MYLIPQKPCLYCRLSYAPDGSLEKVGRQEEEGRTTAARLGWPDFCCVFVDNSRSAWQRNRKRPDWDAMLITFEPGAEHAHDGIMTYHGDRLIRQPYDLELLLNLAQSRSVPLASVSGVRDLSNADDRFILRIEAAQACRESDNISRRQKLGYKSRVRKRGHGVQGGKRPFGFGVPTGRFVTKVDKETGEETQVEIRDYNQAVPDEQKLLEQAAEKILAGLSINGAVRWMNTVSQTTQGNPWTSRVLRSTLTSPRISGLLEHEGALYDAAWDEVIPNDERLALLALFERNATESAQINPGPARQHVLSGALECGRCQGTTWKVKPMGGKGRNKKPGYAGYKVYYCDACKLARNKALLEAYVKGQILRRLNSTGLRAELDRGIADTAPQIGAQILALEGRKREVKQQLENLATNPDLDVSAALTGLASFDTKIAELRGQIKTANSNRIVRRMLGFSEAEWDAEPIDIQFEAIVSLYRIVILPTVKRGPGFDSERVVMTRKALSQEAKEEK